MDPPAVTTPLRMLLACVGTSDSCADTGLTEAEVEVDAMEVESSAWLSGKLLAVAGGDCMGGDDLTPAERCLRTLVLSLVCGCESHPVGLGLELGSGKWTEERLLFIEQLPGRAPIELLSGFTVCEGAAGAAAMV